MIVLADLCVHSDAVKTLTQMGIRVERAIDLGFSAAPDEEIFRHVLRTSKVLLSFDKDFGNIARFDIKKTRGVVLVYIENMSKNEILHHVKDFFQNVKESQLKGRLFIIQPKKIRIWPK